MNTVSTKILIALTFTAFLIACGKSETGGGVQEEQALEEVDGASIDGVYMAKFQNLNGHVKGTIPGSLTFFRKGDRLMTYVRLFAGGPKVWHMQGVYMGRKCPDMAQDSNGDGYLDIDEAMTVTGKQIIPLDSNLNSQNSGRNFFPVADVSGYYHYERISSFNSMFKDLYDEDRDSTDHITKLAPRQPFSWENRVVMIQGVAETTVLPETIAMQGRRRPFQTLPIVCGVIKKVSAEPGSLDTGEIPGPIARVEEGQDRPSDADWEVDSGAQGGTVSGTTGTNDNEDGEVGDEDGNTTSGTTGGSTTGGTTGGTTTGATTGGTTTGSTTTGGTTEGTTGETQGGFIGGFIGGSQGGTAGRSGF